MNKNSIFPALRYSIIAVLGIVLFIIPLLNVILLHDSFIDGKQYLLQMIVPLLLLLIVAENIWGKYKIGFFPYLLLPLGFLFIISVLSFYRAYNYWISVETLFKFTCFTSLYFFPLALRVSRRETQFLLLSVFLSSFAVLIFSFIRISVIGSEPIWGFLGEESLSVMEGLTFGNPNFYAHFLVLIIPVGLFFVRLYSSVLLKVTFSAITILNLYILFQMKVVGAWFALLIGGLLVLYFSVIITAEIRKKLKFHSLRANRLTIVICIIGIIVLLGMSEDITQLIFPNSDIFVSLKSIFETVNSEVAKTMDIAANKSSFYRLSLWEKSLQMIKDSKGLGIGLNNFQFILPNYWDCELLQRSEANFYVPTEQAENDYLQITAELGILGLLGFLWLVIRIGKLLFISFKSKDERRRLLSIFLSIGIVGALLYSFVSFPLQLPVSGALFWLFIGLAENNFRQENHNLATIKEKDSSGYKKMPLFLIAVLTIYLCICTIYFTPKQVRGSYYYKEGLKRFRAGQYHSDAMLMKAKFNRPYYFLTRYYLGEVFISKGFFHEAVNEFRQAVALGNYHRAFNQLASVAKIARNNKLELEFYIKSINIYPCNEDILKEAGKLAIQMEKWEEARFIYETYITMSPDNVEAQKAVAQIEMNSKNYKRAESIYVNLLKKSPKNKDILKKIIELNIILREYDQCRSYLKKYYQLISTSEEEEWYNEQIEKLPALPGN